MSRPHLAVTVARTVPASPESFDDQVAGVTDREEHLRTGMTATLTRLDSAATAAVAF